MSQNLFLLNIDKTTLGVLSNRMPFSLPFFDDLQERSLDDLTDILTFSIPANHTMAEQVTVDKYILYPTFDEGYKLYKIKEVSEQSDENGYIKEIYAEISAQDDLIKTIVRPTTFTSASLEDVLTYILNGTEWAVGDVADLGLKDYKIEDYSNALEALVNAVKAYGGELNYEYELLPNSSVVVSQKVSVYEQLGQETGLLFTHGKDVKGVERIEDTTKLVTALIGVGKADDNGVPMTFSSINPSVPSGYERPSGTDWVGSTKALETYSNNGEHIFGVFKDDNAQSPLELFQNTLEALKKYERPLMTYKVTLALLEKLTGYEHMLVRLGDTIVVQDKTVKPELYVKARIRKLSRSITNPTNDAVELGDYIPIIPPVNQRIADIQAKIRAKEQVWNKAEEIPAIQEQLSQVPTKEDLFSASNNRLKVRYIRDYINGSDKDTLNHWAEIMVFQKGVNIAKGITPKSDVALTNAQYATDEIVDSSRVASAPSGLHYLEIDFGEVKYDLEYIHLWHYYDDARTYNNHYVDVSEDGLLWVRLYNSDKNGTHIESEDGIIIPINSSAIINQQNKQIGQVVVSVENLEEFKQSTEFQLTQKVDLVAYNTKVQELTEDIAEKAGLEYVNGQLQDKANVGDVYTKTETGQLLNGYVNTTQYSTDQNGIVQRFESNESRITQTENEIASKVSQTQYNALEGRVSTAESQITQTANEIATKVTKTEAEKIARNENSINFRYVRYLGDGNTSNTGSHILEIVVMDSNGVNVALNKPVTSGATDATNLAYITDGVNNDSGKYAYLGSSEDLDWAMIDLGQVYENIDYIKIWHYFWETGRQYRYELQVSEDSVNWISLFDTSRNGTYNATSAGFEIFVNQQRAIHSYASQLRQTAEAISLKADADTVDDLGKRLESAELKLDKDEITATVMSHQTFTDEWAKKADTTALDAYATTEDLNKTNDSLKGVSEELAQLKVTSDSFDFNIKKSGGVNLVKNSTGYAQTDFWEVTGVVTADLNPDYEIYGSGSGFLFNGGTLKQPLTVQSGWIAVSAVVKKDATGTGYIKAIYDGTSKQIDFVEGTAQDYAKVEFAIEVIGNQVDIELQGSAESNLVFTALMVNEGTVPFQWSQAVGEVYNTNVQINSLGITVKNNTYDGYTAITPEEFAGYYRKDGVMTEVFSLNKDVTLMNKAKAQEEINMTPMKIVPVQTDTLKGWAFVASDE